MIVKAPVDIECTHCGLPVPAGLIQPLEEQQFCCSGCSGAYQLIHECGLDSFYKMASPEDQSITLRDRNSIQTQFADFASETFSRKYVTSTSQGNLRIKLAIEGIHCAACIWLIEKLPSILEGVQDARVSWSQSTVVIRWNAKHVSLTTIAQTLHQLGYTPYPLEENEKSNRFQLENRKHLSRLGVAAAFAGNNMMISAALYFGMFSHMTGPMSHLMRIASCVIGLAALLIPGRVFLQSAIAAIRTRTPHMDLPIALALLVGTVVGAANVVRGSGEIYFDSLSVLIFLLLIGRFLQFRQQSSAADAVDRLYRLTPRTARKRVDGNFVETLAEFVTVGDVVEVRPGETIPVDGIVKFGESQVDESILTGESNPTTKTTDKTVYAGTLNLTSTLTMATTASGQQTRLSKIAKLLDESSENRPQIVQWANESGAKFVVAIVLLATVTFFGWFNSGMDLAIDNTIALLIVACPCALALATPLSIAVAIGRAARSKVMIKCGDVLQALQDPGMIWLDKTGTLTEGSLRVESWHGDPICLPMVAAIERKSNHPVGRALVQYAESELHDRPNALMSQPDSVTEYFGLGVAGTFDGHELVVGNLNFLEERNVNVSESMQKFAEKIALSGLSPCFIGSNGEAVAVVSIGDAIRSDALAALDRLRERGWELGILSGDHLEIVKRVAERLNIKSEFALGNLSPEEKLETVATSAQHRTTLMVGDGVNDSAALAAATVGIAVKGGAEASLIAAPVYLAKPGLVPILELMEVSDSTTRTMRRNFGVSIAYNCCFAALAVAGFVNPLVAAILMPVSSLTVVSLSLSAGKFSTLVEKGRYKE